MLEHVLMKLLLALLQPWKRLDRDELHNFEAEMEIEFERTAVFGRRRIMLWPVSGERAAERSRKQPQAAERRGRKL